MRAQYLVRFDDVCPTMNWGVWDRVEAVLDRLRVRPIVAVVPDNQDRHLQVSAPRSDFWSRVRSWQERGWSIALHGYQHLYATDSAGIVGINRRSEFAGVAGDRQLQMIRAALAIFAREGVSPTVWVAPGHSFDWQTVEALRANGISVISDGFFVAPIRHGGCVWVPQQLWRFRDMPFGVWTVCCHLNTWSDADLRQFESNLDRFHGRIVTLNGLLKERIRSISMIDRALAALYAGLIKLRRASPREF